MSVYVKMADKEDVPSYNQHDCFFIGSNQLCLICGHKKSLLCEKCNDIRPMYPKQDECLICLIPSMDIKQLLHLNTQKFEKMMMEILSVCKKHRNLPSNTTLNIIEEENGEIFV